MELKKRVSRKLAKISGHIKGSIQNNMIYAYWWDGIPNFGDVITPLLLKNYGYTAVQSSEDLAQIVSTGSLLNTLPEDYSGIILGSGFINDKVSRKFQNANIIAVRGKYTKDLLSIKDEVILGDPGILASRTIKNRQDKKYTLGIIPHYVDWGDIRYLNIKNRYIKDVKIIDVKNKAVKVFKEIDECENILSSSLHGIIVADSLGVPNAWMVLSDKVVGDGFKFKDYNSSIDSQQSPIPLAGDESLSWLLEKMVSKPADSIFRSKDELETLFKNLHLYC